MVEAYAGEQYEVEEWKEGIAKDLVIAVDYTQATVDGQVLLLFGQVDQCNYCYFLVEEE